MVSINRRFEIYTGPSHIADPRATAPSSLYNVPNVSFETNFLFDISILRAETRFFFFFFPFFVSQLAERLAYFRVFFEKYLDVWSIWRNYRESFSIIVEG